VDEEDFFWVTICFLAVMVLLGAGVIIALAAGGIHLDG
jgi:hypothetical protein